MTETASDTAGPLHDLNSFRRDLLAVCARDGPTKGLRLKEALQDAYGIEVHHGRLYPALNDLVEKGLVSKKAVSRRSNHYGVTPRGERELESHTAWTRTCVGEGLDE